MREELKALKEVQNSAILTVCVQVATFIYKAPSHWTPSQRGAEPFCNFLNLNLN